MTEINSNHDGPYPSASNQPTEGIQVTDASSASSTKEALNILSNAMVKLTTEMSHLRQQQHRSNNPLPCTETKSHLSTTHTCNPTCNLRLCQCRHHCIILMETSLPHSRHFHQPHPYKSPPQRDQDVIRKQRKAKRLSTASVMVLMDIMFILSGLSVPKTFLTWPLNLIILVHNLKDSTATH